MAAEGKGSDTKVTKELRVVGMDCSDCAIGIEDAVRKMSGVEDISLFFSAEKVRVSYDPKIVSLGDIKAIVSALGYEVRGKGTAEEPEGAPPRGKSHLGDAIRLAFVGVIGVMALVEIVVERLGLLEVAVEGIPAPLALAAVLIGGYPIFKSAYLGLRAKSINTDLLMSLGIVGAAAIGEFVSSALIVFFMLIAHFLEKFTMGKAREAIKELMGLAPKTARLWRHGEETEVGVEELRPGDIVIVRPGEKIPVDGKVVAGLSSVNQAPITGESIPVEKKPGDEVFAATINELGVLQIEVANVGEDTTLGKIIGLVEEAEAAKAPVQKFADRFTTYFLPIVVSAAAITYLVSRNPVFAIAVLVVACPCAVALATPLAVVASVGSGARRGLLIKGGLYLEALAKIDTVVVDKTGTLTFGRPKVTDVLSLKGLSKARIVGLAASLEKYSEHPLASAVLTEARVLNLTVPEPERFEVLPGRGIVGRTGGELIALGNRLLMGAKAVEIPAEAHRQAEALESQGKTVLFLAREAKVVGLIAVADVIRDEVPQAIQELKGLGIKHLMLLTGDNERTASAIAERLGIPEYKANLLPQDKIEEVKRLQGQGRKVAMIGDGINDAPALAQADVGIAMGVAGTDVALEAATVALMRDDWSQVPQAIRVGRRTFRTIKQNLAFGVLFNVIGITLASIGILTPVLAAAAQSLPDVAVFLNSSKLLRAPQVSKT